MLNQVFISYRHESSEHARAVRRLGELLRQSGLPVAFDQFLLDEHPGGSDVGWPKWCEDCANESACVLIVGSEGWFAAYEKPAPAGLGLGAATEADLFRQTLWDEQGHNARIRLAFLHDVAADKVPVRLRAWHRFRPFDANEELNQLIRWVADRLGLTGIEPPTVRWPEPAEFKPDLADRRNGPRWSTYSRGVRASGFCCLKAVPASVRAPFSAKLRCTRRNSESQWPGWTSEAAGWTL